MANQPKLFFYKVVELPNDPVPNAIYLVQNGPNTFRMHVTDRNGNYANERTTVIPVTLATFQNLANTNSLKPGDLWYITDEGRLVVPTGESSYNQFFACHIGPTPPDDTSLIWFDTSSFI